MKAGKMILFYSLLASAGDFYRDGFCQSQPVVRLLLAIGVPHLLRRKKFSPIVRSLRGQPFGTFRHLQTQDGNLSESSDISKCTRAIFRNSSTSANGGREPFGTFRNLQMHAGNFSESSEIFSSVKRTFHGNGKRPFCTL